MKAILVANTASYLRDAWLPLARALRGCGDEVWLAGAADGGEAALEAEGFGFHPLPVPPGAGSPLGEARAVAALVRLYRRERPEVVHHFTIKPNLYGSAAARLAGVPVRISSVPGLGYVFARTDRWGRAAQTALLAAYRAALGRSGRGRVIFQNPDDRRLFLERSVVEPERAVVICSSGVDTRRFRPTPPPDGPPVVLLASRLLWDKGIGEYAEAARRVRRRHPDARFLLAGRTEPGSRYVPRETLEHWRREGLVEWLGYCDDMAGLVARSHVVTLPSTYREGVPRILTEGAATGRPIVATDVPGCREICVDGVTGRRVRPGDADDLARAILELLDDPDAARRLGRNGRDLACRRFDKRRVVRRTLEVYERAAREAGLERGRPPDIRPDERPDVRPDARPEPRPAPRSHYDEAA